MNSLMKACVLEGIAQISCKNRKIPSLKENEALVQIKACGICSSDMDRFKQGAYHYPLVLGHEMAGEVVAVENQKYQNFVGKKVVVFPLLPCQKCPNCLSQNYAQCEDYSYFGSRCDGGFEEYLAVPFFNLKFFDTQFDFLSASLCEPAAVAIHALSKLNESSKEILILGSGVIGILAGIFARLQHKKVYFLIRNQAKQDFLSHLGFECIQTLKRKFDTCLECVGSQESLLTCIEALKSFGKIILIGNPKSQMSLDKNIYWKILRQELEIIGVWNSKFPQDWDFVLKNLDQIPAKQLITHTFKFEECQKAFEFLTDENNFHIKGTFINE